MDKIIEKTKALKKKNTKKTNIGSTDELLTRVSTRKSSLQRNRGVLIIAVVILAIIIVIIVSLILKKLDTSESTMEGQLEDYASEIYENELKDRDPGSYTLNLQYIERKGYDVSKYIDQNCDKADTYVILNVDSDKNITNITSQLKCNEDQTK